MISEETVSHVATLARLALTPEETVRYANELNKILELVDQLAELDLSDEAMALKTGIPTQFREDTVTSVPNRDKLLSNAPVEEAGFFWVPKILDEGT